MKTIKNKITLIILGTISIVTLISGVLAAFEIERSTMQAIEKNLVETAKIAGMAAQNTIATYTTCINEIATNSILSDEEVSLFAKKAYLDSKVSAYYMRDASYADTTGNDLFTKKNLADEEYFKVAMTGKSYMSSPYLTEDKKDMYIVVSSPVKKGEQIIGVVYFICDTTILGSIVEGISVGDNGSAYILDQSGRTIASTDSKSVLSGENVIEAAKQDPNNPYYAALAPIEQKMISGETDINRYSENGYDHIQSYAPIPGSNGWSVAIVASATEFLQPAKNAIVIQAIVSLLLCILGFFLAKRIATSIATPITACANRLQLMAQGNLKSPVSPVKAKDETQLLNSSMKTAIFTLNQYVKDIDRAMGEMANGNFNLKPSQPFIGDFKPIEDSISIFLLNISNVLEKLNRAGEQVFGNAEQVSDGAQVLAQGTLEQASAIEELAIAIDEISVHMQATSQNAKAAKEMAYGATESITHSNEHMQRLMAAMADINAKSTEISKISKAIEDIAFQTNILALNTAVEAARAGESGKGFAVIADEVRNLAEESAKAAKSTTELIEASIISINTGVNLATETAKEMLGVVTSAKTSTEIMSQMAQATDEQVLSLSHITSSVDRISSVVQTNSATSQQSAAASEELSGQAHMMKELIGKFELLDMKIRVQIMQSCKPQTKKDS